MTAFGLLRDRKVPFDINVTAMKPVLDGLGELIDFAERERCRRVNVRWPSTTGLGGGLSDSQIPAQPGEALVRHIEARQERRPGFFAEIERGSFPAPRPLPLRPPFAA